MLRRACLVLVLPTLLRAQSRIPLESVSIEGSVVSRDVILETAGLQLGAPIDKSGIEAACEKLDKAGIFESINYKYAPGPKHGYSLTLILSDQHALVPAAIDIAGNDEEKTWRWVLARYPAYDHRVPAAEAAQLFLAHEIEAQTLDSLHGQHLAVRMESDLGPPARNLISFQPEVPPRVTSMSFTGQHEFPEADLIAIMQKVMAQQGYLDRSFRSYVDLNLRPLYERHGMYRVRFPSITSKSASSSEVAVTAVVEEGAKFTLADVQLTGDKLPVSEMLEAASFQIGHLANWSQIESDMHESEKYLKRTGYMDAFARPERSLDDEKHTLSLRIVYDKGPLYRVGEVKFTGLDAEQEAIARKMWRADSGAPYDYTYPSVFLREYFQKVDFRRFKKYSAHTQVRKSEPVMDVTMLFEAR